MDSESLPCLGLLFSDYGGIIYFDSGDYRPQLLSIHQNILFQELFPFHFSEQLLEQNSLSFLKYFYWTELYNVNCK